MQNELPTTPIRTLGLYQPFAGLMLHDKIETRRVRAGRKAPFPLGFYLLYATAREYSHQEIKDISGKQYERILDIRTNDFTRFSQITGHAICVGELVKVFRIFGPEYDERTFVQYRHDDVFALIGLEFKNVRKIAPFPFKGKQGIGFVTDEQRAKIKFLPLIP